MLIDYIKFIKIIMFIYFVFELVLYIDKKEGIK